MTVMPFHRCVSRNKTTDIPQKPRLVVGIASTGRSAILTETVRSLATQIRLPDLLVISVAETGDVDGAKMEALPFPVAIVTGPKGASAQRNRILECLRDSDVLLFLDDDFVMARDYIETLEQLMALLPETALLTGTVLADGVVGAGLTLREAQAVIDTDKGAPAGALSEVYNGYGCNMAVRAAPIVAHGLRFDEALPLYSWLEDVDFSRQLAAHGRLLRSESLRGVHLGTKAARTPGQRLGYSQIANPIYLMRKGTLAPRRALRLMARNVASNLAYSVRPRPWTDSRGRLRGNLRAVWDTLRGRVSPARVLDL